MATEIVTAKAGTNHVDSDDIGALYAGGFGKGRYALNLGNNLKCSMMNANTLVIGTGGLMFDGRFVRVKSDESLTVTNGTQSQYRKDLAVLTYKRDASNNNIETVSWSVLRGTPASSESAAKVPTFTEGSILDGDATASVAVAEVDLAGLTPTCKLLLPTVTSLAAIGDSVSLVVSEPFAGGTMYRVGRLAVLQLSNITLSPAVMRKVGKLPVALRKEVNGVISYNAVAGYVSVKSDGTVYCYSTASGDFSGQVFMALGA